MKAKLASALATAFAVVALTTGSALAWTFNVAGSGMCQPDGSFKITWTVNNTTEEQELNITASSNEAVVPVGTKIPANETADFTQTVSGTQPGSFSLSLSGNWQGDQTPQTHSGKVYLREACKQPTPVPTPPPVTTEGGRGGGEATPAPVQPQVVTTPAGAVNAGSGHTEVSLASLVGLVGSLGVASYGLRRFVKVN